MPEQLDAYQRAVRGLREHHDRHRKVTGCDLCVGGDLWAVVATWDLTPLEAAVLGQR